MTTIGGNTSASVKADRITTTFDGINAMVFTDENGVVWARSANSIERKVNLIYKIEEVIIAKG